MVSYVENVCLGVNLKINVRKIRFCKISVFEAWQYLGLFWNESQNSGKYIKYCYLFLSYYEDYSSWTDWI